MPVLTPILLIFTIAIPNSTLKVNPAIPLKPRNRWTIGLVEASVHSSWSDRSTPRPFLRLLKKEVSNRPMLPVSSPTRFAALPLAGHCACSWGTNVGLIEGSTLVVALKLFTLKLKVAQEAVPIVCPPTIFKENVCRYVNMSKIAKVDQAKI